MIVPNKNNVRFINEAFERARDYYLNICQFCDAYASGICPATLGDIDSCILEDKKLLEKIKEEV